MKALYFCLTIFKKANKGEDRCYSVTELKLVEITGLKLLCQRNWLKNYCLFLWVSLLLNVSWNYFISAIYWKIHTCVAKQLSSSWLLLLSFSTRLLFTQYKKIDEIWRRLGARISPLLKSLLHHCICVLCVHAIQCIIYVKDTTYKKPFPFFPHSLQFFLPVKLAVIFATETCWTTYAF